MFPNVSLWLQTFLTASAFHFWSDDVYDEEMILVMTMMMITMMGMRKHLVRRLSEGMMPQLLQSLLTPHGLQRKTTLGWRWSALFHSICQLYLTFSILDFNWFCSKSFLLHGPIHFANRYLGLFKTGHIFPIQQTCSWCIKGWIFFRTPDFPHRRVS